MIFDAGNDLLLGLQHLDLECRNLLALDSVMVEAVLDPAHRLCVALVKGREILAERELLWGLALGVGLEEQGRMGVILSLDGFGVWRGGDSASRLGLLCRKMSEMRAPNSVHESWATAAPRQCRKPLGLLLRNPPDTQKKWHGDQTALGARNGPKLPAWRR